MMRLKNPHPVIFPLALLTAFNLFLVIAGFMPRFWWAAAIIDSAALVYFAEKAATLVPSRLLKHYEKSLALVFPILLLSGWELVVGLGYLSPDWFPPPSGILRALWGLMTTFDDFSHTSLLGRPWLLPEAIAGREISVGKLLEESHLYATLMRVFSGFFLGGIPGILLGVVMGRSRTVRTMIDATLSAFYVLPKIAIFPIMMLVFPDPFGEGPKIAVVAISVFFLVTINTMVGVRDIDPVLLEAAHNYGARRAGQLFRHVVIPGAMPVIFAGLRIALGTALIVIIAVEFVRAKTGVGFLTFYYWEILAPEKMYAGLVVVMLLGVLLTAGLKWVERAVMPWRKDVRQGRS